MKKILLLSMPFGAMERPALGLSLLKARLTEAGFPCDVRYLTFAFAEYIGHDAYQWMCYELPYTAFAGDWCFTGALYENGPAPREDYEQAILRDTWRLSETEIERIRRVRSMVPHFLEYCMSAVRWADYGLVGFTSTFEQNIASLALARRIKRAHPALRTVFGGANWEADMGLELHRQFPFVDFVCSGEAEETLPRLARHVLKRRTPSASATDIPGLVCREADGSSVYTGPPAMISDMDGLPVPDFSDYFRDLQQCTVSSPVVPTLLFETSRGCWWGAKSHCTFCGLNGGAMAYRSKSPRRALDELEYLVNRWQVEQVEAVDNILDMKYFRDMLPALAKAKRSWRLFYEVKANLSREQLKLLRDAGVERIQPGIESMSDHVLFLMRKGTTSLRNVQMIKWSVEHDVSVEWNILYGFPGETAEDYEAMLDILKAIRFLKPPCATGPIRLDRFSPYHTSPADFGLVNVRPMAIYHYLYPFDADSLARIAYYFDFDYAPQADPSGIADRVVAYATDWQRNPEAGTLVVVSDGEDASTIIDTRSYATISQVALTGLDKAAYDYCDEVHSRDSIIRHLRARFPDARFDEAQVTAFLDSLVANKLMVRDGDRYLSLAIRCRSARQPPVQRPQPAAELPVSSYLPAASRLPDIRIVAATQGEPVTRGCGAKARPAAAGRLAN